MSRPNRRQVVPPPDGCFLREGSGSLATGLRLLRIRRTAPWLHRLKRDETRF
jgi:hypothetical protein